MAYRRNLIFVRAMSLAFAFLALGLSACNSSENPNPPPSGNPPPDGNPPPVDPNEQDSALIKELRSKLRASSPNASETYFKMPDSNQLELIPQDPRNPLNFAKVRLGQFLFHETALLVHPQLQAGFQRSSCASCHAADAGFQAGIRQGIGEGGWGFGARGEGRVKNPNYPEGAVDVVQIRSPSVMNMAYQSVIMWNGAFGSTGVNAGTQSRWTGAAQVNFLGFQGLESQAIAGQDAHRLGLIDSNIASIPAYNQLFNDAFPELPFNQRISQTTAGLAIAAYERSLLANRAPFQRFLRGDRTSMSDKQIRGGILFFGKAQCVQCHTGPALNSMSFQALGMDDLLGPDVLQQNVNHPLHFGRGGFTGLAQDLFRFKVPQLYNLKDVSFLGHGGTFHSVREVIEYKNRAIPSNGRVPASALSPWFRPLNLSPQEIDDLTEFVREGLYDPALDRYKPAVLPTGFCSPDADFQSIIDLGC